MRFSLTALIRLIVVVVLGSSAVAVGVSRLAPPLPKTWRMIAASQRVAFNGFLLSSNERGSLWIDPTSGEVDHLTIPTGERFECASFSPWTDERGESQVVGRWSLLAAEANSDIYSGIARVSYPGGEFIDRVVTDTIPISSPCWLPGDAARIVFAASDGKLYYHAFESVGRSDDGPGVSAAPLRIRWTTPPPGSGEVFVGDPHLVRDPGLPDILLVSLSYTEEVAGKSQFSHSRLWWLRLGDGGRTIVEHGPLLPPSAEGETVDHRSPTLGEDAAGQPVLAFLAHTGPGSWRLFATPLRFESGRPGEATPPGPPLATDCQASPLTFSADGRFVYYISDRPKNVCIRKAPLVAIDAPREIALLGPPAAASEPR